MNNTSRAKRAPGGVGGFVPRCASPEALGTQCGTHPHPPPGARKQRLHESWNNSKLWGGRFRKKTAKVVEIFTHSLSVDQRLARYDLTGSIAHARMLGRAGVIPKADSKRLVRALEDLRSALDQGKLTLDSTAEDIHTAIQRALLKRAGPVAEKLHTARSRNDQVVTSLRLYCKEKVTDLESALLQLQRAILAQAERASDLVMPGMTHLRHAQPIGVGHLFLSYLSMLERDRGRFRDAFRRMDELPLGSGALTGTALPIDRISVAKELGFSRIAENSVDAVTDRDFVLEILSASALLSVHLSRMAEDLILWSTREFGFLTFQERMLTGSSMMPQKQNPDFLELTRGGSALLIGNLTGMLSLVKGLSTGYQRDLQLDKELLFKALDKLEGMLSVMGEGFQAIRWNRKNLEIQLSDESLYATDLAEYLVQKGVPFAQAHQAVGRLFTFLDQRGMSLKEVPLSTLRRFSPAFGPEAVRWIDPLHSVRRKRSAGSTNPAMVAQAIRRFKKGSGRPGTLTLGA